MEDHACPGGCGRQVSYTRLSCPMCWARLPRPLRDEVNDAYRWRRHDPLRHLRAVQKARLWYDDQGQEGR